MIGFGFHQSCWNRGSVEVVSFAVLWVVYVVSG